MKKPLVLFAAVFLTALCAQAQTKKAAAPAPKAQPFDMFIITTNATPNVGGEDPALTQGLEQMWLKGPVNKTTIDYEAAKFDPKFKGVDMSYMPVYLIKRSPAAEEIFKQHIDARILKTTPDFIVFERQTRQGVYMNKEVKPDTLEIFVMSQCPYGAMAENRFIEAQKAGKIPANLDVKLRFIVTDTGNGSFRSLHGTAEWEENVRQLIIQKYYPKKLWSYLEERNKDYMSSRWDLALKKAGISASKIDSKWEEGVKMLQQDAAYAREFNISGSPSFLWEGRMVLDFNTVTLVPGLQFMSPNLNPAAAPLPAGSC